LRQRNRAEAQNLVNTIRSRHAKEPGIQEMLVRVLAAHGLVRPDGLPVSARPPAEPTGAEPAVAPVQERRIWTPDRPAAADRPAQGDRPAEGDADKPKIWTPGMD
jgi:hypothetical protein